MPKQILIAPNAFKNSLSAIEAGKIIKLTLDSLHLDIQSEIAPIADGGDGTMDIFKFYFPKSKFIECNVHDPLMRAIKSSWLLLDKETAVIELAKASGLTLLKEEELNPMWANTFGTGELILSALNEDCKKIIITLGGSATVDAGTGILRALGVRFYDDKKQKVKAGGGFLGSIQEISFDSLDKRLKNINLNVLCDVKNPLLGNKGFKVFSAQKGAKEGEIIILENGMEHYVDIVRKITGLEFENKPMAGAAGGITYSLKVLLNAELFLGFNYISNLTNLEEKIIKSDLIITGEGSLDAQTLSGKGVFELSNIASKHKKKVIALCGMYDSNINWSSYGIFLVFELLQEGLSLAESLKNAKDLLQKAIKTNYKLFIN